MAPGVALVTSAGEERGKEILNNCVLDMDYSETIFIACVLTLTTQLVVGFSREGQDLSEGSSERK